MRVYPHDGLSIAIRKTRSTIVFITRGRQGVKRPQHLAPERLRFSSQPAAFGVCKTKALPTQASLEYAVLLLQILDDIQLMSVDPAGEHQED
jgi:hypothetical protein